MLEVEVKGISWDKRVILCYEPTMREEKWFKVANNIDIKSIRKGHASIVLNDNVVTVYSSRDKVVQGRVEVPATNYNRDNVQTSIIRQSCLKAAIEYYSNKYHSNLEPQSMELVLKTAEEFEKWVLR